MHIANFAEIEIVKASYKAMTKLYHPDLNKKCDPKNIVKINLAYEILGNIENKRKYDEELKIYLKNINERNDEDSFKNEQFNSNDDITTIAKKPTSKFGRWFVDALGYIADSFKNQMYVIQKETENAYFEGLDMQDEILVKVYLKSVGSKRNGYAQALVEKGLLFKEDGKLVPSYTFKKILRGYK